MALFKLNLPNDYASEEDIDLAFNQAFGEGADPAQESDVETAEYEPIAEAANDAGLEYVEESTYGAIWKGTDEQFAACIALLPSWAQRYASKVREQTIREWMEDRGDSTDEYSRLPQENMEEEVIEAFVLSDGSRVAFTENSYVISHGAGHDAGEAEAFYEEHPAWAAEVRRQREE